MGKTVFVPLTDDLLYEHPDRILGPVIPFSQQARWVAVDADMFSSTTPPCQYQNEVRSAEWKIGDRFKAEQAFAPASRLTALG